MLNLINKFIDRLKGMPDMEQTDKSKVALVACAEYEQELVNAAVKRGVELLGGIETFVSTDEKILLKPNLLKKAAPDEAVTTHPTVFTAVAKLLQSCGHEKLFYGDSPGPGVSMAKVAEAAGIKQAADECGVSQADFNGSKRVDYPQGKTANSFIICKGALEADAIINLCKMKTHGLERITGAVKNTFGCVAGINKGAGHAKYPDPDSFGKMLADLNNLIKPKLHIMDAVVAMEGNGPGSGDPVKMKLLLFSADPVALDSVFCALVNLEPSLVATNIYGEIYGVGKWRPAEIEVVTESGTISVSDAAQKYGNPAFNVNRGDTKYGKLTMFSRFTAKRPYIVKGNCIKCGLCVTSCPIEKRRLPWTAKMTVTLFMTTANASVVFAARRCARTRQSKLKRRCLRG
jgi:uncharacterized protein (DUF362 family)